ncbi:MAG: SulP family inorganic anion transporter [Actinomycetota bacterium]
MSERGRSGMVASVTVGLVIGVVEGVLAISFAALVYGGYLAQFLSDGIGLFLVAAALTLAILAWRAGLRGVVGSVPDAVVAVLAVVATTTALDAFGSTNRAFITVIGATMVVTLLTGITFLVIGTFKLGNLIRFVPYPVVGGFLAGAGWLLLKGGISVASGVEVHLETIGSLIDSEALKHWLPALAFGVILLLALRLTKKPLVIPIALAAGLALFAIGMLITGSSVDDAWAGFWMIGPFHSDRLFRLWTEPVLTGADWSAVIGQAAGIATAVFVAVIACLFNVNGIEQITNTDLDPNRELRDGGIVNLVSGLFGGVPGYHAPGLTALAQQVTVNVRTAGLVAAAVPLAAVMFGASVIERIPRMIVGGVLVSVGLGLIVEWVWDKRRTLPALEQVVVLVILAGIVAKGFLPGVVIGLVMAVVLFAVSYGRIESVHEVAFGDTYRSNVDRPPDERAALRTMDERVQILRVQGFVFFGSANGLLERIRKRVEAAPLRFLLIDLRQVTGVDASAVVSFVKVIHLAEANGFELVIAGASDPVRKQLGRGGVVAVDRVVRFEPDLDHGLQRCEDVLLEEGRVERGAGAVPGGALDGLPQGLRTYLERMPLAEGTVLIRQDEPPDDVFVLESGRLQVEMVTPEGTRVRLRTLLPGAVVGEIAMYTGDPRTADVVAERPSVVLRLSRTSIERMEATEPALAAALHRWLARTLSERLTDTQRAVGALFD